MKNIILSVCLLAVFFICPFSLEAKKKISREEAYKDIEYYFSKVDSIHPNMYWNTSEEEIENFKQEIKEWCNDSVDVKELNLRLTESNHFFDYHTGIIPDNGIDEYYIEKYGENIFLPLQVNDEGIWLEDNVKIISINDMPIHPLIEHTKKRYGADHNSKRINYLISKSSMFQYTLLEKDILPPYKIKVETPLKKDSIISCESGVSLSELKQYIDTKWQEKPEEPYKLVLHEKENIAIIQFNKCVGEKEKELEDFDKFLAQSFKQIENLNIQNLFIDVTWNGGGDTRAGGLFLNYLAFEKDLNYKQYAKIKSFTEEGEPILINKMYKMNFSNSKGKGYQGNVFVCYGFYTSSSAPFLVEALKISERGILVGDNLEPQVPVYIDLKPFELPYSGIKGMSSYKYFYKETPSLDRNYKGELIPDIKHDFPLKKEIDLEECLTILDKVKSKNIDLANKFF